MPHDTTLSWMRPTSAQATLAKAADKLGIPETHILPPPVALPAVHTDFWGQIVIHYEAGAPVAVEQRELR